MRKLQIEINCGELTCAAEPGKFCKFFGTRKFGSVGVCMLFPNPDPGYKDSTSITELEVVDGWTRRCKACLQSEACKHGQTVPEVGTT